MFGEKITKYDKFSEDIYGYILRVIIAPTVYKIKSIQLKTATGLSDVVSSPVDMATLLQYPLDSDAPDLAYSFESGILYIFIQLTDYPYEDTTEIFIPGYRYPTYLDSLNDPLDIPIGNTELFVTLCQSKSAELQGKVIPQRILDTINYLKTMLDK